MTGTSSGESQIPARHHLHKAVSQRQLSDHHQVVLRFLYNVDPDAKGHTGGTTTLGNGAVISSSLKHKINVLRTTEEELVVAHIYMPMVIWTLYFIMLQGYSVEQNIVFQDNQSTMKLQKNRMLSSTKQTKHRKARQFFMTDRIGMGGMEVQ